MKRLLIVANRLPVNVKIDNEGISYQSSSGGLATGLDSLEIDIEKHWIGWPGIYPGQQSIKREIEVTLEKDLIHPVFLSKDQIQNYYEGFSNKTIWPLFHYFTETTIYDQEYWDIYKEVNEIFCEKIVAVAKPDDIIWVQDYHLMLLPQMLRKYLPHSQIGFFLHIPFPSYELFRTLPWRKEILEGLLGADLVGFHTYEYMRHFLSAVSRISNYEHNLGLIYNENRTVQIDAFPMGIDYDKFHDAIKDKTIQKQVDIFREKFGKVKMILSVDRLDYSKGILQRLKAFDRLLTCNPEFKGQISLILLVVPSRYNVSNYKELKEEIDKAVGNMNGKHGTLEWTPIYYLYRSVPFKQLSAFYNLADVALVTPFRDGMNLVAKEFVASKNEGKGVLILSEMAGSSLELTESVCINPNDIDSIVESLEMAINMSDEEQEERLVAMQAKLSKQTVQKWANDFIKSLNKVYQDQLLYEEKGIYGKVVEKLKGKYTSAENKLILLDYDGTLVPYTEKPSQAVPDEKLLSILEKLAEPPKSTVVLFSGRDHETLQNWFKDISIDIIAEYGSWYRINNVWKRDNYICDDWRDDILNYLKEFVDKTPGSFLEEKSHSVVWHYRKVDEWLANLRVLEFMNIMVYPCTKHNLEIIEGIKSIEVRVTDVKKYEVIKKFVKDKKWDFIMAIGDDQTDEEMFRTLPKSSWSIKVGYGATNAKFHLPSFEDVRKILTLLPTTDKVTSP